MDVKKKIGIVILVVAAVLLEVTSLVQYWFASESIREEVVHRAHSELKVKSLTIQNALVAVEAAVKNMTWVVEKDLQHPDSMYSIARRLLVNNPNIVGVGIVFKPNYYKSQGKLFEPYAARRTSGEIETSQLASESHDYTKLEFYIKGLESKNGHWCDPYLDSDGARMMLTTYSYPIYDKNGEAVAVVGADVSLDWLDDYINAQHIYPSSYNIVVSRTGQLIVCPVESLVMRQSLQEATAGMNDTSVASVNQRMMAGESGQATVISNEGDKNYVFYAPIEGSNGWSMAVVAADKEIYRDLRQVGFYQFLLMLFGLGLLAFILQRSAGTFMRLQKVNAEKERIGSELRIASGIQRGMLPKIYPPYPDRHDIEIYAMLDSAKEVGGDLFDFYIRDEKLFFCIGDVSGKGVPASLVMAVTRSLFRTISAHQDNTGRIVGDMNNAMSEMNEDNMFVTMFVGKLDLATGKFHYCNAGHCAPLLVGDGVSLLPMNANVPMGLMSGWQFEDQKTVIQPGTTIFLYTDGLIEAEDGSKKQFGEERMIKVAHRILEKKQNAPESMIKRMADAVKAFVGGAEQSDDLTMLAVKYTKNDLSEEG